MEKSIGTLSLPNSSSLEKNVGSVHTYLKNTFNETKREISEGLSSFKDGITGTFNRTGTYINNLVLPVNNFLKDVAQIEKEFEEERRKNEQFCICLDGQMVPAEEVLNLPMEENY
jgi:hypothetical protein